MVGAVREPPLRGKKDVRELELTIHNPTGLHARPAKTLVGVAKRFKSKIRIGHGAKEVNGKSLISVLTLGVGYEGSIRVKIDGEDEQEASLAITEAVQSGLGEETHVPAATNGQGAQNEAGNGAVAETQVDDAATTEQGNRYRGVGAADGVAIGRIFHLKRQSTQVDTPFTNKKTELNNLNDALSAARKELHDLVEQTRKGAGSAESEIFEAHLELLDDADMIEEVQQTIAGEVSATTAWQQVIEAQATALSQSGNEILAARSADLRDVGQRVLWQLTGESGAIVWPAHPVIVVAEDLLPSETATLDKAKTLGFCTVLGSPNGHSAILARALGLPAVVGTGKRVLEVANGTMAVLDGATGVLEIEPSAETLAVAREKLEKAEALRSRAESAAKERALTKDGKYVEIVANVGSAADAKAAYEAGAEGVGLLRTEFLFLGKETAPTEDDQHDVYRAIVSALHGQPVIVRTLDVGGDKPLPYIDVAHEENPFLGERGIRLCLNRPNLLREQLRAIVRASSAGKARIMFPMVSDVQEIKSARQMVSEVCAELGVPMVEVGIMVEVPSAALMADVLAKHVDFFSIGTNDLTQYTLAIDRMHPTLSKQADGLHPAVLRLIAKTVAGAHAAGKWVGVCGELGADSQAVPILVGLGVDELSVNVPAVPMVKQQIRGLTLTDAQELAHRALACASAQEVRGLH